MAQSKALKRWAYFAIGSAINVALFCLSKYLGFPLWLDYTGSFYITIFGGPAAGGVSILLHTVLLTVLIDGQSAMWLLVPAVFAAAVVYSASKMKLLGSPIGHIVTIFAAAFAAFLGDFIIFIINVSPPKRYSMYTGAFTALYSTHGRILGTVIMALAIAFAEIISSLAIFSAAYFLTPRPKSSLSFKK